MDTGAACHGFGVGFRFSFPVPELEGARHLPQEDCQVSLADPAEVTAAFSGLDDPDAVAVAVLGEGVTSRIERGGDGDLLLTYADRAVLHISAAGDRLLCAPQAPASPEWRRYLLDTGLATVALLRGFEALHAGAVVTDHGVVAIVAGEGGGKSTFVAELMRRGLPLFCDDILALSRSPAGVMGHAGPPVMNLVPELPDGRTAASVGRVVATLDGECWVVVDPAPRLTEPVAAVVVLDRGPHTALSVETLPRSPTSLLAHMLRSGRHPARMAARFDLFGDLATQTRQLHLRAPADMPPATAADALIGTLEHPNGEG